MYVILLLIILIAGIYIFINQPQFGKLPKGQRLEKIKRSPNYRNGQFQNLNPTPSLAEDANYFSVLKKFIFEKDKNAAPSKPLPSVKTDLHSLKEDENVLIWFGHSSYFIQVDGKKILVDPVFSRSASPMPMGTKAFKGADIYSAEDIPEIDYLFITHDHWDHLDYPTIKNLKPKIRKIITGLGTGEHFEAWNFAPELIEERDWNEVINLEEGFTAFTTPARHFSGRGLKRNTVLWTSFVLQIPTTKIFMGGDSGYDDHFAVIGSKHGPFDLVILENGQYNRDWKYIHMMPEEVIKAAKDLKAKKLLPVHSSIYLHFPYIPGMNRFKK